MQEKIRNLGKRLKKLKYDFIYTPSNKKKQEGKMIKVQEQNFRDAHRELTGLKSRFTLGCAVFTMLLTYVINSYFWGKQSAVLPFQPYGFVTGMSHRGLEGDDMSQVSMTFICVLMQMATRGMLGKLTGSDGPRMPLEMSTPQWLQDMQKQAGGSE